MVTYSISYKETFMSNKTSKYFSGKIIDTKHGTVEILKVIGRNPIKLVIRFEDTGYTCECRATNLVSGKVIDHRVPSVYGVGFRDGIRIPARGTEVRNIYDLWANMLKRCYGGYLCGYEGVTVAKEWHNFKTFLNSFTDIPNYEAFLRGEDVHLDKDLRVPEKRMYSLQTCQFIPAIENTTAARHKRWGTA